MSMKISLIIIGVLILVSQITFAQTPCGPQDDGSYILCSPIPGMPLRVTDVGSYVGNIYRFALMIGGIIVFARIVYGGLKYIFSAGNVTAKSDARDVITQAIWGLTLLLGAFLILNTVNPNLIKLKEPGISQVEYLPDVPFDSPSDLKENQWLEMREQTKIEFINDEVKSRLTLDLLNEQRRIETDPQRIKQLDQEIIQARQDFLMSSDIRINSELHDVNNKIKDLEGKKGATTDPNAGIWSKSGSTVYNLFTKGRFSGLSYLEEVDLENAYERRAVLKSQLEKNE